MCIDRAPAGLRRLIIFGDALLIAPFLYFSYHFLHLRGKQVYFFPDLRIIQVQFLSRNLSIIRVIFTDR